MFEHKGWWLPDGEQHLVMMLDHHSAPLVGGRGTYQYHKLLAALRHVRDFRRAVDVGAHVGFWSWHLAQKFHQVECFEPVAAHRDCFEKNMQAARGYVLWANALGEAPGTCHVENYTPGSCGDTRVNPDEPGAIPLRTLDSFDFQDVDFLKIDCEGYELFVLRGAVETLKRCKPCVIVEQKPGHAQRYGLGQTDAVTFLQSLGATLHREMAGDYILSWGR